MIKKTDLIILLLLFLTTPLFFYKLGQNSLISFDEAWYGDIGRNILVTGNLFNLTWNGNSYTDHPPAGFWLIALGQLIFGINEFGVRIAAAFCGFLSVIILYLLGKELFNRTVGVVSALALPSAFWFLFRARSGNLDVILIFGFLLTFYLAIKASKNKKFLIPLSLSLGFLILTKTLVPFTIIPALIIIFWKTKHSLKDFLWPFVILTLIIGAWLVSNLIVKPDFLNHYLKIGLPGVKTETDYLQNFALIKEYLHSGVGKWFWPGVISIFLGLILRQRRFLIFSVFFFSFFIPFIFSEKGHIWHLVPLHPILISSFFGFSYVVLEKIISQKIFITFIFIGILLYVSFLQTKRSWYEFIDVPKYISDEEILSKEAGKYPEKFLIDGDFLPTAVYYSGKNVNQISTDGLISLFERKEPVLLITYQWRLDGANIKPQQYQLLKTDRDKMLILIK